MTEPNPTNPWARPPDGTPEQPVSYEPPPLPPTSNWAYDPQQQPPPAPPQRSLTPIIAIIVAAVILLCVGAAVAGTLVFNQAKDAVTSPTTAAAPSPPATDDPGPDPTDDPFQLPTGLPGLPPDLLPSGVAVQAKPDSTVVYEVTGEGRAAVTYVDAEGPGAEGTAKLPWRKEFTLGSDTPVLTVGGIQFNAAGAELTCRILLDGKEIVKRSAGGNAATASCTQVVVVS